MISLSVVLILAFGFLVLPTTAPIPPCSPLRFINKVVESPELAWLLSDLPGHPVGPCKYNNVSWALKVCQNVKN